MVNRKRPIILRCPVTAEERNLIEQKMAQLQTKRIGAYLRKMAIDGYIIYVDTRDIKEMNQLLSAIGPVSYTHLDVYKRQGYISMAAPSVGRRSCAGQRKAAAFFFCRRPADGIFI